jgi:hypothetical protein
MLFEGMKMMNGMMEMKYEADEHDDGKSDDGYERSNVS